MNQIFSSYLFPKTSSLQIYQENKIIMLPIGILEVFLALVCFIVLRCLTNKNGLPVNWPIIGMLPDLLLHAGDVHDWSTGILKQSQLNFLLRGFWFTHGDMLLTADPRNIHYIMSSNFENFPKGPEFKRTFDVLGDGIFNADTELWKNQRKVALFFMNHGSFHKFLERAIHHKLGNGLIPLLQHAADKCLTLDLQDVFQRFTFDVTCKFVTGYDPGCVSIEFPEVVFSKALDDAEEVIFHRHLLPEFCWKVQGWLGIGTEKKMAIAWRNLDQVIAKYIDMKRQEMATRETEQNNETEEDVGVDLLTSYMTSEIEDLCGLDPNDEKFLRDTILNFMLAGRDTTSSALTWFFWVLSRHPSVETKIRDEVNLVMSKAKLEPSSYQKVALDKLVYLHCALCESLRLYPPVPFQHKSPLKPDVLPSGHKVDPGMQILFNLYGMGRMSSVWGEDCLEFKPERWITARGGIRHEPSYKFVAFNAGPRTCIGKEVAFIQMKSVVAAIISHGYKVEIDKGHHVIPSPSIILHMRHSLAVKITKQHGLGLGLGLA